MMNESVMMCMKVELERKATACRERQARLAADERTDESIHARIEQNVYEAFAAVLNAAAKQADPVGFFRARLEQIPSNWVKARETALAHNDAEKAHLETIKLTAAEAIEASLQRIMEEQA